jgi:hypothetical protein
MRSLTHIHTLRLAPLPALIALTLAATVAPSTALADGRHGDPGAVFVQTNDSSGKAILACARTADGTLTLADRYPTLGRGHRAGRADRSALLAGFADL